MHRLAGRPARLAALVAVGCLLVCLPARAQRFLPDDPVTEDRDHLPIPLPGRIELATGYDVVENTFLRKGPDPRRIPPAQNVNTLGEVPDSSWWQNRIGVRALSLEEIARGPNDGEGPDTTRPLTIIGGKTGGITPGFTVRDARGDVYFVKFDPPAHFGLATGADVIGSKLFHAFGYHVPTNWIVYFEDSQLVIAEGARTRDPGSKARQMLPADVAKALAKVARLPDGRVRAVASRAVPGKVVGPRKHFGTRPDDPNDVIPHEHRRELRGYRVFCAWLNHDDSRGINALDSWVERPGGGGHLVHYVQDFSSILGSGSNWKREIAAQNPRAGNEYIIEWGPIWRTALSFGIWQRPWHRFRYEVYPQVGAIEAEHFDPELWRPEFPNAAFQHMLEEDAFWAARIVSKLSEPAIRAVVAQADLRAPEAEEHLVRTMVARRDKVLARYFARLNPLADFRVAGAAGGETLDFANYGEDAGLATLDSYEYQWFAFDNATGETRALGTAQRTSGRSLPLPEARPEYLMARIRSFAPGAPAWQKRVDVFLRTASGPTPVGIERESSHPASALGAPQQVEEER